MGAPVQAEAGQIERYSQKRQTKVSLLSVRCKSLSLSLFLSLAFSLGLTQVGRVVGTDCNLPALESLILRRTSSRAERLPPVRSASITTSVAVNRVLSRSSSATERTA